MYFNSAEEIVDIASKTGTAVFVVPRNIEIDIKGALILQPEEKSVITVEQVRDTINKITVKQIKDVFVVIRPADKMNEESSNAFLKNLEEPQDKVHFILITDQPSRLLPTILSRANIYFLKDNWAADKEIIADQKCKDLAKKLLTAKPAELVDIAEEISKNKDGVRAFAMDVLGVAIEMIYKSYFLNGKEAFLVKLPKFLKAYEGVARNGHVKLQIVSNLC